MQIGLRASPHVTVAGRKYKVFLSGPGTVIVIIIIIIIIITIVVIIIPKV